MNRKILIVLISFSAVFIWSCKKTPVGFLDVANANYAPDSMIVKLTLDPVADKSRITNNAPWVSNKINGVLGTNPLVFSIAGVRSETVDAAEVAKFSSLVYVQGLGRIHFPLNSGVKPGKYIISLDVQNSGDYKKTITDVMTVIVK